MLRRNLTIGAGIVTGIAATMLLRHRTPISFRGRIAFVTGGSRGLGLRNRRTTRATSFATNRVRGDDSFVSYQTRESL